MKALAALSLAVALQTLNPSPRAVVRDTRVLQPAEIVQVLAASRQAVAGSALRLSFVVNGPGMDVVMADDGWPEWMRTTSGVGEPEAHVDLVTIEHFTHTRARGCDGRAVNGDLVVEYEQRTPPGTWTVKARVRSDIEVGTPIFNMLSGATAVESGAFRDFDGGRRARAFTAPWTTPPGGIGGPVGAPQSLWVDVDSLRPLRWSLTVPEQSGMPALPEYGLIFTYDEAIDVRAPDGVVAPDCVR